MHHWIAVPFFLGLAGCIVYGNSAPEKGKAAEGAFAGECHNGEDDDGDDLVDCRDDDCFEASNCADHPVDTGGDTGADTGNHTGADTGNDTGADTAEDTAEDTAGDTADARRRSASEADPRDEEHSPLGAAAQLGAGALLVLLAGRSARRD